MRCEEALRICVVFCLICPANIIGLWWAHGSPLMMDPNRICRKSRRLGGKQHEICRKEREVVHEVAHGAAMALAECQWQFRNDRWNCTAAHRAITKVLKRATREAAFVNAITAAGVVHTIARGCGSGALPQCTCGAAERNYALDEEWVWGGCNDNVDYGYEKSREFMDVVRRKTGGDVKAVIESHNNEAGRLAVKLHMRKVCKCHGHSGSCSLRTCFMKMPPFRHVGERLREKFLDARKVTPSNDGNGIGRNRKAISDEELVYLEDSPNYCNPSRRVGSLGTENRNCDPDSNDTNNCDSMCCGRGYRSMSRRLQENCNCSLNWCCEVVCQTCERTVMNHVCN